MPRQSNESGNEERILTLIFDANSRNSGRSSEMLVSAFHDGSFLIYASEKAEDREAFVDTIFEKIRGSEKANFLDFAYAHDTTRVLQSCLQHGTAAQRRVIYEEVKLKVAEMAQSKYARNMVLKLIKYGERDIKDYCIENMGNVRKLVRSSFGQSILGVKLLLLYLFLLVFQNMLTTSSRKLVSETESSPTCTERVTTDSVRLRKNPL